MRVRGPLAHKVESRRQDKPAKVVDPRTKGKEPKLQSFFQKQSEKSPASQGRFSAPPEAMSAVATYSRRLCTTARNGSGMARIHGSG